MNYGKCKDCKWIETHPEKWGGDTESYSCSLTITNDGESLQNDDSKALAYGSHGYGAVLYVKPDFGCIQFESKEAV